MNYTTELKQWGSTGVEYPAGYKQEDNVPPVDAFHNFLFDNLIRDIQHLVDVTNNDLLLRNGGTLTGDLDADTFNITGSAGSLEFGGTELGVDANLDVKQDSNFRGTVSSNTAFVQASYPTLTDAENANLPAGSTIYIEDKDNIYYVDST